MSYEDAVEAFVEQIEGLKARRRRSRLDRDHVGRRRNSRGRAEAAVKVGLPYVYTGSFGHGRQDHDGPASEGYVRGRPGHWAAVRLQPAPIAAVGASDILSSLLDMTDANPQANIIIKGNCGIPEFRGSENLLFRHAAADGRLRPSCPTMPAQRLSVVAAAPRASTWPRCAWRSTATCRGERPTVETIVERIGPMRNKTANEGPSAPARERGSRRRG